MKIQIHIFYLFALCITACTEKIIITEENPDKIQLETEIINQILGELIPDETACVPPPLENESHKEYEKRLYSFRKKLDSIGLKIGVVKTLKPIDTNFVNLWSIMNNGEIDDLVFKRQSNNPRKLYGPFIKQIQNIEIIDLDSSMIDLNRFSDCRLIGQIQFSKMNFNEDSTEAVFSYDVYNGSCTVGDKGIIQVEKKYGKWKPRTNTNANTQ